MKKYFTKETIKDWLMITFGIIVASLGFSFFIQPNNIVTGGVSGIGVLLSILFEGFDPALVILILNIFLLIVGLIFVGKSFFIKTVYGSIAFPLFIKLFDVIYDAAALDFTSIDMVLVVLFAALLTGLGLGFSVKHGGSTGGFEILQRLTFKYLHIPYSVSLYIFDGSVIALGLFLIGNWQMSLYAVVFTFLTGIIMDMIIFSGFNRRAVYIVSKENEKIKNQILDNFNRGVTSIKVVGEYSKEEKNMLVCVMATNEYYKLRTIIEDYDPTAFYYVVRAHEVRGEGFSYEPKDSKDFESQKAKE